MKILAVETATEACSAALLIQDEIIERWELAPKAHTRLILPMIDGLMAEAGLSLRQLDALAFGCGPGSFTGVRIATGVVHGIALGADLPVLPVSTLAAIAQDYFVHQQNALLFVAMDARMGEVYWGVYQRNCQGIAELLGKESVTHPDQIERPVLSQPGVGIGSGWLLYRQNLLGRLEGLVAGIVPQTVWPRASAIARLGAAAFQNGKAVPVERALPVYLRDKVAKTEQERVAMG